MILLFTAALTVASYRWESKAQERLSKEHIKVHIYISHSRSSCSFPLNHIISREIQWPAANLYRTRHHSSQLLKNVISPASSERTWSKPMSSLCIQPQPWLGCRRCWMWAYQEKIILSCSSEREAPWGTRDSKYYQTLFEAWKPSNLGYIKFLNSPPSTPFTNPTIQTFIFVIKEKEEK